MIPEKTGGVAGKGKSSVGDFASHPQIEHHRFAIVELMSQKGFSVFATVLFLAVLAIAGGVWYYEASLPASTQGSSSTQSSTNQTTAPTLATTTNETTTSTSGTVIIQNSMAIDTSSWKTCTNYQYGYSIKYPPSWVTWEQAQNWGRDQNVSCEGKWAVTFAPSDAALERVDITAYPQATNTRLPDGSYYIKLPKYGDIGNPFGGYNSVDAYFANYFSSSAVAAPHEIHQDASIDGEKAVWTLDASNVTGGASSMTVYHNGTFYYVDYFFDRPISSTDTDYLYFQAMAESFRFL